MNPQTRQQALAEFDRQISQSGGRAQFPTAPGQPLQGADYSQALRVLQSGINPPDGAALQALNQIPSEVIATGILNSLSDYWPTQF
jgi:hypothetical protein